MAALLDHLNNAMDFLMFADCRAFYGLGFSKLMVQIIDHGASHARLAAALGYHNAFKFKIIAHHHLTSAIV
jgi:hypothetical protein